MVAVYSCQWLTMAVGVSWWVWQQWRMLLLLSANYGGEVDGVTRYKAEQKTNDQSCDMALKGMLQRILAGGKMILRAIMRKKNKYVYSVN